MEHGRLDAKFGAQVGQDLLYMSTTPATTNENQLTEELPKVPPDGPQIDGPVLQIEHGLRRRRLVGICSPIRVAVAAGRQVLVRVVDPVLVEVHLARHRTERNGAGRDEERKATRNAAPSAKASSNSVSAMLRSLWWVALQSASFEIMAAYAAPIDKFSSPGPGGIYKFLTNFCSDKTLLAFTLLATPPEKIK